MNGSYPRPGGFTGDSYTEYCHDRISNGYPTEHGIVPGQL